MIMGRLVKLLVVLLPLAGFVLVVLHVRQLMNEGQGLLSLIVLLGALVLFVLVETLLLKFWILPPLLNELGERVYAGGSYTPAEDALFVQVERIRETKNPSLLPELEKIVLADVRRTRGWQEYAHVLQDVFADAPGAFEVLRRGAENVSGREDRAMLLCRAAYLASESLHDAASARELYSEAARRYPRTVYGQLASRKLTLPPQV